jgi:NAD(P)H-flavin reductase
MKGGADGITAINTLCPELYVLPDGTPILTNQLGGVSGRGIKPAGLRCVREIRRAVGREAPIIAMGGISTAGDVEGYQSVGGNIFGIGSALAGMNEREIRNYFSALKGDLQNSGWTDNARALLKEIDTQYRKVGVVGVKKNACDLTTIVTNSDVPSSPGQFVFALIPGEGEKPFSVMDDTPLTFGILERGKLTRVLNQLRKGDSFYVRGPYGRGLKTFSGQDVYLVGGGCGIAGLYLPAKKFSEQGARIKILLGAKDEAHLLVNDEMSRFGEMLLATEDGSLGLKGNVGDLLRREISQERISQGTSFYNCGPKAMIDAVLHLERSFSDPT